MERKGWLFWLLQPTGSMCHLILLHTYKSASNCFLSTNISRIYGWKTATFFTIKTAELLIKLWKLSVKGGQWCFLKGFFFHSNSQQIFTQTVWSSQHQEGQENKGKKGKLNFRKESLMLVRTEIVTIPSFLFIERFCTNGGNSRSLLPWVCELL